MTSKEALENIKNAVEYITRLDYVDPVVRGEVKQILFDAYNKTTPEFDIIERDLKILEILKKYLKFKNTPWSKIITCDIDAIRDDDYEIVEDWLEEALAKYE